MDNRTDDNKLSPEASRSRREYYRKWRADNKSGDRAIKSRYWEKKAREIFGDGYIGPAPGEDMSQQAREVRRKYYAEYRNKNPETVTRAYKNYWEKKAKEIIK